MAALTLFGCGKKGPIVAPERRLPLPPVDMRATVEDRVTVNALGVGFYEDVPGPQRDEELHAILQRYIPLRRLGTPADLQGAVVYLASNVTNFIQGELLVVDGAIANHA